MQTGNFSYWYGGDYCSCRRCPCCGKLVAAPYTPYYPGITYTIPHTIPYIVPNGPIDWGSTTTSVTVTVDGEKK